MRNDVPKGTTVRHPRHRRRRHRRSGQRSKEVMLSDLSVSASWAPPQGQITSVFQETCQTCPRSRAHGETRTKVKRQRRPEEAHLRCDHSKMAPDRQPAPVSPGDNANTRMLIANVLTLPKRSKCSFSGTVSLSVREGNVLARLTLARLTLVRLTLARLTLARLTLAQDLRENPT